MQKPTIATNCVGPREILDGGEYGLLVDNDGDSVYSGMKTFLTDCSAVAHYKEKAKARAEFFEEERIINELENILKDL